MAQPVEPLPILVARFADDAIGPFLAGVALAGRAVYIPLVAAPASSGVHLLQVHMSGQREPLSFLAEPLGPCSEKGYPIRLAMVPSEIPLAASTAKETPVDPGGSAPALAAATHAGTAAADPFIGRSLASGKLLIEARVGEGGAGTVYRARHRDLQMPVAVKVMHEALQRDPEFCKRFHAEALSASRLDHAHLTRVLDFGQEPDGLLYIAMEFLDGRSLREVLDAEKALSFERVARLMIQVCSGLTHAHARSIVHRDIKPENLVLVRGLDEDGRETDIAKVCDFGIAHRSAAGAESVFAGTAEYISPEQYRGDVPDAQSDVYSCGVVLYELLTGVVPIAGDIPEIVDRVASVVPDPPSRLVPGLDPRIDRLVMKALAKDREVRHASVRELRTELKETAEEISLFSAGGYYDAAPGASTHPPTSSGRPAIGAEASGPDWLERGTGYHASSPPPSMRQAVPPARLSQPAAAPSSIRAGRPSYSDVDAPPSSRIGTAGLPSLGPPPARHSHADLSAIARGSILTGSHVSMTPPASSEADEVARGVASFVKSLVVTTDPEKFAALVAPLGPKVTAIVEQGYVSPAWRLCSALSLIATEPAGAASRAHAAHAALAIYSDRAVLTRVAEYALDPLRDRDGAARKLLVRAGDSGAHAAYGARTKHGVYEARERFIAVLREIGSAGLPTVRKALTMLETRLGVAGAIFIAEDLLKSVADIPDEELGQCITRYAKGQSPTLALLATSALSAAWGRRARPILVAQIHHKEADVAIMAMKCLRTHACIDADVVGQLRPIVLGTMRGIPSVRLAATEVLGSASTEARPLACSVLAEALASAQGVTPDVEELVVSLSSAIIAAKGDATLVAERWKKSNGFLRTRLELLLRQARQ